MPIANYRIEWNDESVIRAIEGAVKVATKEGAKKVAATARRLCPVEKTGKQDKWGNRPGSLKASIRVEKSKFKNGGYLVKVGGKGAWGDPFYAPFVELGTPGTSYQTHAPKRSGPRSSIKARAFLRPGLARNKRKFKKMFQNEIAKTLSRK